MGEGWSFLLEAASCSGRFAPLSNSLSFRRRVGGPDAPLFGRSLARHTIGRRIGALSIRDDC